MPRVSIGLPVYNGEEMISRALDSLLAQEFQDFEIIISDNASQDRTGAICLEFAQRDPRIQYHRNESNIGATRNFNRVFAFSSAEYFKWAGHDDSWAPEYLQRCVDELDRNEQAILVYCPDTYLNDDGDFVCRYDSGHGVDSSKAYERFCQMLWSSNPLDPVYALIRREALEQTRLFLDMLAPDKILAVELSLIGPFAFLPEPMVFRRAHSRRDPQERLARIAPHRRIVRLSFSRRCWEYLRVVVSASLSNWQRLYLAMNIVGFFVRRQVFRRGRAIWDRFRAVVAPIDVAASRAVDGSIRVAAFCRFSRRATWEELRRFLVGVSAEAPTALWYSAAKVLASRDEAEAQVMLVEWVLDSAGCRRAAAASVMKEDPDRWSDVLDERLDAESSSRVRKLIERADAPPNL